ncbi:MAG: hypothetical protein K9M10_04060 [Candidatus Pacebacteria bacterium]|nr:hypothetical protein [Candidatus Paceibacterota bacterium]MCF7857620.1 hypothetical protein [Candidatus Paceibacterota bacterium]
MKQLSPELINAIATDTAVRTAIVYESHEAFCSIYLRRHLKYDFAFFHREMFRITEKYQHKLNVFMAFRGSGKSTILNLSNALWSITGKHKKKFVLIVSKTRVQSQSHFENIKQELQENELLKHDLGPFQATKEDWGAYTIEIPKYGAKIMCIGANQNIRGLKYRDHRPDLIICDDIEDITSFEYGEKVELLYEWFMGELLSIGDETTNIVVLGNLLNPRSIMCKLAVAIRKGEMPGLFRAYPLLDDRNRILWSAKYPDVKAIKDIENGLPKPQRGELYSIFAREYLLDMSHVRGDNQMDIKHATPIRAGGTTRKGFEISAPLWALGTIMEMEDENWVTVHYEDGYPLERFQGKQKVASQANSKSMYQSGLQVHTDRPNRLW